MDKIGTNYLDGNLVLIVQRDAIRVYRGDLIFVIDIEHHILRFLIHSAKQDLSDLIFVCFSQYFLPNSSTDIATSSVCVCDVGYCIALFHNFEIFLQRFQHWDRFVEDVVLELLENFALAWILQPLALAQEHVVGKNKIDTAIEIFVVIVRVRYKIDGF